MKKSKKQLLLAGIGMALMGAATADAAVLDLTTAGSSGFIGDAFFQQVTVQPAGTGVIEPFLRIQETGTQDGFEHGYNTSANNPPLDAKSGPWTHDLLLTDLTTASLGGTNYYTFLLDINETGVDPLVTLSGLQIFQSTTGGLSSTNLSNLGTKVYDLGSNSIELNYDLNPGSGAADMLAYIPTDLFNVAGAPFVYFYSAFGTPNDAEAGFEEWATVEGAHTPVPEPGTVLLLGAGFVGLALYAKRRRIA